MKGLKMDSETSWTIIFVVIILILILQIWGNWNQWQNLEDRDLIIKELTEKLDAGIFVEVFAGDSRAGRVVTRNDSGHIWLPICGGTAIIIKTRDIK